MKFYPYNHFDGEVSLFPAWSDGIPKRGPSEDRDNIEPHLSCHASIGISRAYSEKSQAFGSTHPGMKQAGGYTITVSSLEGAHEDHLGSKQRFANRQGKYCLVILYRDDTAGVWNRYQFFHVEISNDETSESDDVNNRTFTFTAQHLDEDAGYIADGLPSITPVVYGYVDWIHGGQRIPCIRYDAVTGKWSQRGASDTGILNQPYAMWDGPDVPLAAPAQQTFSLFQPRADVVDGEMEIVWQQRIIFSIAGDPPTGNIIVEGANYHAGANGIYAPNGTVNGLVRYSKGIDWNLIASPPSGGVWRWILTEGSGFFTINRYQSDLVSAATPFGLTLQKILPIGGAEAAQVIEDVPQKNQMLLHEGIELETNGSAEPVASIEQSAFLDESYCIFHSMGKVFMMVGHDRIAVPMVTGQPWLIHHGFAFRLGDTVLDQYGWWNVIA